MTPLRIIAVAVTLAAILFVACMKPNPPVTKPAPMRTSRAFYPNEVATPFDAVLLINGDPNVPEPPPYDGTAIQALVNQSCAGRISTRDRIEYTNAILLGRGWPVASAGMVGSHHVWILRQPGGPDVQDNGIAITVTNTVQP